MKTNRAFIAVRALLWGAGFVAVWTWAGALARGADISAGRFLPFAGVFPGLALAATGALLVLSCVTVFVMRGLGTAAPFDPPRRFVAAGPYRFVRNPMYIGAVATLAGAGLALRSQSLLALAAVAGLIFHAFVLVVEEPGLDRRFGETYREYRRTTRRWIPRVVRAA